MEKIGNFLRSETLEEWIAMSQEKPIMAIFQNFLRSNTSYFIIYYGGLMVLYLMI